MDNRLLDIIHAKVCNDEYYVIQNPLLITRVMQPICDILGVEVPTMRDLQKMFDQVDRKCGSCYSSDGCRPQFLVSTESDGQASAPESNREAPLRRARCTECH